jgi:VanZ family protein
MDLNWLRRWGPSIAGAVALWILSTSIFSDQNTALVILPVLRWLFPAISPRMLHYSHLAIRKLAHLIVYFVFNLLLFRSIRGERKGWKLSWALAAFAAAAGYAALDEFHQLFVPLRHASVRDVLIDMCGAFAGQVVIWRQNAGRSQERMNSSQPSGPEDGRGAEFRRPASGPGRPDEPGQL